MKDTVANIYFTSWQYVRIGSYDLKISSGGSGVAWLDPQDNVMCPPCDCRESVDHQATWADDKIRFKSYSPRGISLVAQKPTKVKFDDPLGMDPEASPVPVTIVFDEGRYKCWYAFMPTKKPTSGPPHQFNQFIGYAESSDGFKWTKPKLGLYEYEGSRDNNIVFSPYEPYVRNVFCPGVYIDDHGDPSERYKMLYYGSFTEAQCESYRREHPDHFEKWGYGTGNGAWGLSGAVSADGINWRLLDEPMLVHFTDIIWGNVTYDVQRKKYLCYHRSWPKNPKSPEDFVVIGKRSVARSVSTDFRRWSDTEVVLTTGADTCPSHVFYQPSQTPLPGCDDQQVMFVFRWKQEDDTEDMCLYSTPDGWSWSPVPAGSPILTAGQPGTWEGSYIMGGGYLVELPGDRWAMPYMGFPIPHKYPRLAPAKRKLHTGVEANRGYAIWPKGRLVALDCPDHGAFATVAVKPAGQRLFLNANVDPSGYVKIGVKAIGGADIPGRTPEVCDAIHGKDGIEIPVTWNGQDNLNAAGQPVIFTFEMCRAKVFGLSFK